MTAQHAGLMASIGAHNERGGVKYRQAPLDIDTVPSTRGSGRLRQDRDVLSATHRCPQRGAMREWMSTAMEVRPEC